jgi:methenyltetrahydrofolate cyclohydrolase
MDKPGAIADQSIGSFLDALAAAAATPGGGSATALMGAMAAALVGMVCGLSIERQPSAAARDELAATLRRAQELRARLCSMIDADVAAFDAVMRAYALPKSGDADKAARSAAIQRALHEATLAPLECARACAEVMELARLVAQKGHTSAAGEAAVAALASQAAVRCAALNVRINAGSIRDGAFVESTLGELEGILRQCGGVDTGG